MLHARRLQLLIVLSTALLVLPALPLAEAAPAPTLKISSSALVATGSTININVTVMHFLSSSSFDTFDISVVTDPNVLVPMSITLGPKVASWTEFTNCVNGVGTGCGLSDGSGVAHEAATSTTGLPIFSKGASILFTITYSAVNGAPSTSISADPSSLLILHAGSTITPVIKDGNYCLTC